MRLVTDEIPTPFGPVACTGALTPECVIDLGGLPRARQIAGAEVPTDMLEFLRGGEWAMHAAREVRDFLAVEEHLQGAVGAGIAKAIPDLDVETWSSGVLGKTCFSFERNRVVRA
jgi:hypothetical protein